MGVVASTKLSQVKTVQAHVLIQAGTCGWDCWAFVTVPVKSIIQVSKILLSCLIKYCNQILAALHVYNVLYVCLF
jgi:hypothetical protein